MSQISALVDAQDALIAAIDAGDLDAIEAARAAFAAVVAEIRAAGAWRDTAELRAEVAAALASNDAARIRLRYHQDHVRTRLDTVAGLRGQGGGYDRAGALRFRAA